MKNTRFWKIMFLLLLWLPTAAMAQQKLEGKVVSAVTGEALAGARVTAHGFAAYAAMTDETGGFTLSVPEGVALIDVEAPGYNTVQQAVGACAAIQLWPDRFAADYSADIAVTALRSASDFGLSGAVSVDDEIASRLGADVRTITRSGMRGSGAAMLMNGLNSLHANAMPLVVVDGVFLDQQRGRETLHDGFYNNLLANVNVADIERVTVLKNGTSLYGTRGANGVIVIETRRSTSMATRIEVNGMAGVEFAPAGMDLMNASQFRLYASELIGGTGTRQTTFKFLKDDPDYYFYNKYHNETRWADYLYREALTQNYSISVQGGDEVADYNLSLGYVDAQSTLLCNDFSRLGLRFNTDIKLGSRLKTRFDVAYNQNTRDLRDDGAPEDFAASTVLAPGFLGNIKSPFLHPYRYDEAGRLTSFVESADDFAEGLALNSSWANPVAINTYGEARNKNRQETSFFNITIAPRLDLGHGLTAQTLFSYGLTGVTERSFVPMTGVPVFYIDGVGESSNRAASLTAKQESLFSDTRLNWSYAGGPHTLDLTAGLRYTTDSYTSSRQEGHNTGNDKTPDLAASLSFKDVGGVDDQWCSMAYYLMTNYSWRYTWFVEGGLTMETTSRFGRDAREGIRLGGVKWGLFPSLQGAWMLSNERFMAGVAPAVNQLKLRIGYDESGNDDIDAAASRTTFASSKFLDNSVGLTLHAIGNNTLQWETTRRLSAGLDMKAWNNRLDLSLNLFKSFTSNLLTLKSLPEISGEDYYWSNDGALENMGADIRVNLRLIGTRDWRWEAGFSAATYRNRITSLPDGDFTTTIYGGEVLTAVGQPAGLFYGYRTAGVFSTTAEAVQAGLYNVLSTGSRSYFGAGDVIFVNQDNDPAIDDRDKVVIGNPNPDLYGNIFTTVGYRRLTLDALLGYSWGNDVYNYMRRQLESGSTFFNQTTALNRRWTCEGQQTDIPRATFGDPMGNARFSDRWIEDGSYLRLRRVTLSYRLPVNSIWMQGLTVWVTGNNLFTLTNYLGSDPESSVSNQVLYQGIDVGLLAQGRSLLIGLKLNL